MTDIFQGLLNVEAEKSTRKVLSSYGRYPVCIPAIGRGDHSICERCKRPVVGSDACEAVPTSQRWDVEGDRT